MNILNISGYKFVQLSDLIKLQKRLKQQGEAVGLKGTILLSEEGININLAGSEAAIEKFKQMMLRIPELADITFKESYSEYAPFQRMLVKIKKEIIAFDRPNLDTSNNNQHEITAKELKAWYDQNKDFTILDTRNKYEYQIGTFENAVTLDIDTFKELPEAVDAMKKELKQKPMVMFCTGGVRCEKVIPVLLEKGYTNIYQLQGGILQYFEECGGAHYRGECFVFDDRVALDANLSETKTILCEICQYPITEEQQQSDYYQPYHYCPNCYQEMSGDSQIGSL